MSRGGRSAPTFGLNLAMRHGILARVSYAAGFRSVLKFYPVAFPPSSTRAISTGTRD